MLLSAVPSVWISTQVLLSLVLLLGGSTAMFWVLVRRWESHRQEFALIEWGRRSGLKVAPPNAAALPAALEVLKGREMTIRRRMIGADAQLLQFQTAAPQTVQSPIAVAPSIGATVTWNLLVRHMPTAWRPTGLRPTAARISALDLFALASFPTLGATERFIVFGADSDAAAALSQSMTRSLLPPDVGILLYGREMLLDFSDRPFDEIEFNRMLALADQIVQKLPAGQPPDTAS